MLARFGFHPPMDDAGARKLIEQLVNVDDRTLREVLIAFWMSQPAADDRPRGRDPAKWDLPADFGQRILKLARAFFDKEVAPDTDDGAYFQALFHILVRMHYAPALEEAMRPGGILALHFYGGDDIWPGFGKEAVGPLLELGRAGSNEGKRALELLGKIRDDDAIPSLQALLQSASSLERVAAVRALRGMEVEVDLAPWRERVSDPKADYYERAEAAELLARNGSADDVRLLISLVDGALNDPSHAGSTNIPILGTMAMALAESDSEAARIWTLRLIARRDLTKTLNREVRGAAIDCLGGPRGRPAQNILESILNDPSEAKGTRARAAYVLAKINPEKRDVYVEKADNILRSEK